MVRGHKALYNWLHCTCQLLVLFGAEGCCVLPPQQYVPLAHGDSTALFNPETAVLIQKRHPYTGSLNSETLGDSETAFLPWGDVLQPQEAANHSLSKLLNAVGRCYMSCDLACLAGHIVHGVKTPYPS